MSYSFNTFRIVNKVELVNKSANLDARYGPWKSINDALTAFNSQLREQGLTVAISGVNGTVNEYWYKDGITDNDLILKIDTNLLTFVRDNSGNWTYQGTDIRALTGNWQNTFTHVRDNSGNWTYLGTDIKALTSNWENTYTHVRDNSGSWTYQGTDIKTLTGNWENTYTHVRDNSGNWTYLGTDIKALTGNWQNTFTHVRDNSGNWTYLGTDIKALTGNWQNTYTHVRDNSGNWTYLGTDIKALTGNWQNTYTHVRDNSGNWTYLGTDIKSLTANWENTYTHVRDNSGNWTYQGTDIKALTGNWQNAYNHLNALSSSFLTTTLTANVSSDVTVGAISATQVIPTNTGFQQFVEALLTKVFNPTFTDPSASLTSNLASDVELGTTGITFTLSLNKGAISGNLQSGVWNPNLFQNSRAGDANNYTIFGVDRDTTNTYTSANAIIGPDDNVFGNSRIDFNIGPQPFNSKLQNFGSPLPAGFVLSNTITIRGRRRMFYGADTNTNVPTLSSEIRNLPQSYLNPVQGLVLNNTTVGSVNRSLFIPAGSRRVIFAYPATLNLVSEVRYFEAGNASVKDNFIQTTIDVPGLNERFSIPYRVYYYIASTAFGDSANYFITI